MWAKTAKLKVLNGLTFVENESVNELQSETFKRSYTYSLLNDKHKISYLLDKLFACFLGLSSTALGWGSLFHIKYETVKYEI